MNLDQEIARLNIELQKDPNNMKLKQAKSVCLNNKALALSKTNKHEEALRIIKQAIKLETEQSGLYCNQANIYMKLNRYNEAYESATKALELEPESSNVKEILSLVLNNQFTVESQKGNDQQALEKINKAIELNPNDKIFYYNKALVLNKMSKYVEANETVEKGLSIDSKCSKLILMKSVILNQQSLVDSDNGQHEDALNKINLAIDLKPTQIGHHVNKGSYLTCLNRVEEARQVIDKALPMDLNNKDAQKLKEILSKK